MLKTEDHMALINHIEDNPVIIQERPLVIKGICTFKIDGNTIESPCQITCTSSRAYITLKLPGYLRPEFTGIKFSGTTIEGESFKGFFRGDSTITNNLLIAACGELIFGNPKPVKSAYTYLIGAYFENDFSLEYNNIQIEIFKSEHSIYTAKRTYKSTGAILPGSKISVNGENLDLEQLNELFRDISFLLRPATSSEVFFRAIYLNNDESIIYHWNNISGDHFGFRNNILESPISWQEYLTKGLHSYYHLNPDDRNTISHAGYSLAASLGTVLVETGLMHLITSLERLGKLAEQDKNQNEERKAKDHNLKKLKENLVELGYELLDKELTIFSDSEKQNILNSIKQIKYHETKFMQAIVLHLKRNNWDVDLDIKLLKELRDSLMHTGSIGTDISLRQAHDFKEQLEQIIFVHVLDLIGYEGLIGTVEDRWRAYAKSDDIKNKK